MSKGGRITDEELLKRYQGKFASADAKSAIQSGLESVYQPLTLQIGLYPAITFGIVTFIKEMGLAAASRIRIPYVGGLINMLACGYFELCYDVASIKSGMVAVQPDSNSVYP